MKITDIVESQEIHDLCEAVYPGMIGMMEVSQFIQKASESQKKQFKQLVNQGKKEQAWKLIQSVLGYSINA